MDAGSIPNIFLDFKSGRSSFIRWRFLENLEDDILKQRIVVCSKLINVVSHISHERGRFEIEFVNRPSKEHAIQLER
jgi:hypothetical protein